MGERKEGGRGGREEGRSGGWEGGRKEGHEGGREGGRKRQSKEEEGREREFSVMMGNFLKEVQWSVETKQFPEKSKVLLQ